MSTRVLNEVHNDAIWRAMCRQEYNTNKSWESNYGFLKGPMRSKNEHLPPVTDEQLQRVTRRPIRRDLMERRRMQNEVYKKKPRLPPITNNTNQKSAMYEAPLPDHLLADYPPITSTEVGWKWNRNAPINTLELFGDYSHGRNDISRWWGSVKWL